MDKAKEIEESWEHAQGYVAFVNNKVLASNPYRTTTLQASTDKENEWDAGWKDAKSKWGSK